MFHDQIISIKSYNFTPDEATESVAENSSKLQPSINCSVAVHSSKLQPSINCITQLSIQGSEWSVGSDGDDEIEGENEYRVTEEDEGEIECQEGINTWGKLMTSSWILVA